MSEKSYLYQNFPREDTSNNTERTSNESFDLTVLEASILAIARSKPKSEAKIAREVKTNIPIVSHIITELMLRGFLERTRGRRIPFVKREFFSTTIEGINALEYFNSQQVSQTFFHQFLAEIKVVSQQRVSELVSCSLVLRLIVGMCKMVYRMARYLLSG